MEALVFLKANNSLLTKWTVHRALSRRPAAKNKATDAESVTKDDSVEQPPKRQRLSLENVE